MRLESMRKTHKMNIIATWLCTVVLSGLSFAQNGLTQAFYATIGVMLCTAVIVSVLRVIPFNETAKGSMIVCCIGLATLLCSVMQGGSDRNFLASFFVLGLAMMYFNSRVILSYGIIYMSACVGASMLNPAYIDGADHVRARVLIKLVIYCGLTILLYFATRKGEKMLEQSEEDAKIMSRTAQEQLEMSQNLNVIVENSNSAMEELSAGADSIAAAANEMSGRFNKTLRLTEQLNSQMYQVSENMAQSHEKMQSLTDSFKQVNGQISVGMENAEQAKNAMTDTENAVSEAEKASRALLVEIAGIQKQLGEIESIASQTNLISINASIEAARAGAAGKSFSEVARQVSMLAGNSAQVAQDIGEAVKRITDSSNQVFKNVNGSRESVNIGREKVSEMRETMSRMLGFAQNMDSVVSQQQSALDRTDAALVSMQAEMEQVAGNARKNTVQVENVASSIEEQSASTREISEQLQEIAALSAQSAARSHI